MNFYIALPADTSKPTVSKLIRHALAQLESDSNNREITLDEFILVSPYIEEGLPSVFVDYSNTPKKMLKLREENLGLAQVNRASEDKQQIEFSLPHAKGMAVNSFTQRLAPGDSQHDGISLLAEVANTLDDLGDITVTDMIYHPFCDDDGLDHPYVTVYYRS